MKKFSRKIPVVRYVCLMLLLFAQSPLQAIPINQSLPGMPDAFSLEAEIKKWRGEQQLSAVISMLEAGKYDAARLRLGQYLAAHPEDVRALDLAGMILLEVKKFPAAEESFRRALAAQQNNGAVRAKLGVALLLQGKLSDGEHEFRNALQLMPDQPLALRYMAWLAQSRGDIGGAIEFYQQFLATNVVHQGEITRVHLSLVALYNSQMRFEDSVRVLSPLLAKVKIESLPSEVLFLVTESYIEAHQSADAEKMLKQYVARVGKGNPQSAMLAAQLLRSKGETKAAVSEFDRIAKQFPTYYNPARYQLARSYLGMGDSRQAMIVLEDLVGRLEGAELVSLLQELVGLKMRSGNVAAAISLLHQADKKHSDNPFVRFQLAQLLAVNGEFSEAIEKLDLLIQQNPSFIPAYYLMGKLERALRNYSKAEKWLEHALRLNKSYLEAWIELAGLQMDNGRVAAALATLEKAKIANPGQSSLLFEQASIYEAQGALNVANKNYREILQLQPDHVGALNNLSLNLVIDTEHEQEALRLAKKAYALAGDNAVVIDTYGWVMFKTSGAGTALSVLEKAASLAPSDGQIKFHLGVVRNRSGDKVMARQAFQQALKLGVNVQTRQEIERYLLE